MHPRTHTIYICANLAIFASSSSAVQSARTKARVLPRFHTSIPQYLTIYLAPLGFFPFPTCGPSRPQTSQTPTARSRYCTLHFLLHPALLPLPRVPVRLSPCTFLTSSPPTRVQNHHQHTNNSTTQAALWLFEQSTNQQRSPSRHTHPVP
ncbi:hypothetical protein F5Y01DRAFT_287661 [Xylaria sp. FL0043]|nr:hypothetical protein F5Y01DRAFT_287661 [Xylaria sp. FL0043]